MPTLEFTAGTAKFKAEFKKWFEAISFSGSEEPGAKVPEAQWSGGNVSLTVTVQQLAIIERHQPIENLPGLFRLRKIADNTNQTLSGNTVRLGQMGRRQLTHNQKLLPSAASPRSILKDGEYIRRDV